MLYMPRVRFNEICWDRWVVEAPHVEYFEWLRQTFGISGYVTMEVTHPVERYVTGHRVKISFVAPNDELLFKMAWL